MEISNPSIDLKFNEQQLAAIEAAKNIVTNLQAESVRLAKLVQVHEADVKEAVAAKDALDAEFEATGALLTARKAELAIIQETLDSARKELDTVTMAHKELLKEMESRNTQADEREVALNARATEQESVARALEKRTNDISADGAEMTRKKDILAKALESL